MSATADTLLIVNADDLGRTAGINGGIFEANRRGIVTSATLMVAYPAAVDAAARLAEHPSLGVGLHVALTGGPPVLPPDRLPSLVDDAGRLPRRPDGLAGVDPAEVAAEVRAQFDRFRRLTARLPTHLDGHHHCHRVPVVLEAVVALAAEHGLPVRDAGEGMRQRLDAAGLATTDRFDDSFYAAGASLEALLDLLAGLGPGSTELMCHPGQADAELTAAGSTYVDDRLRELEVLTHPRVLRAVDEAGIRLGHFGHLAAR